ncbi:NIF3-like protein 1 [Vanessa tameamea]|uniref:NIF3-like protein 1 n=1 Tax=Vanessa tameamea TaxID=334116 RepID=A0A8B8IGL3_VANTA
MLKVSRNFVRNTHFSVRNYCSVLSKMSKEEKTGVKLNEVICVLEKFAPKQLSESWDNTGLLVEPYTPRNIKKILLTNDLTEDVALEAKQNNCEMVISYHPPIFAPLKSVIQSSWKERIVSLLLENRITLYSPHTSWDSVKGGVNDWLASAFPFVESVPIIPGMDPDTGAGRLLHISDPLDLSKAIEEVKMLTGLKHIRLAIGKGRALTDHIKNVALCAGSGSSVLKKVAEADLFLTGEMLHHDILDATQRGISVILTNHSDSERGFLCGFSSDLQSQLDNKVLVLVSEYDKDPLSTV